MQFKPKTDEGFYINKDFEKIYWDNTVGRELTTICTDLSIDVSKDAPVKIQYIFNLEPISGENTLSDYSVGDSVRIDTFVPFNENETDRTIVTDNIVQLDGATGVLYDPYSQYLFSGNLSYDDNEDTYFLELVILQPIEDRLIYNGNGVYMDKDLYICRIYEPREVVPEAIAQGSNYNCTHFLTPYKTYLKTDEKIADLTLKWDPLISSAKNLKNYIFRGEFTSLKYASGGGYKGVEVHLGRMIYQNVPSGYRYKYDPNIDYQYVIEYDDEQGKWLYTCTADTEKSTPEGPSPSPSTPLPGL